MPSLKKLIVLFSSVFGLSACGDWSNFFQQVVVRVDSDDVNLTLQLGAQYQEDNTGPIKVQGEAHKTVAENCIQALISKGFIAEKKALIQPSDPRNGPLSDRCARALFQVANPHNGYPWAVARILFGRPPSKEMDQPPGTYDGCVVAVNQELEKMPLAVIPRFWLGSFSDWNPPAPKSFPANPELWLEISRIIQNQICDDGDVFAGDGLADREIQKRLRDQHQRILERIFVGKFGRESVEDSIGDFIRHYDPSNEEHQVWAALLTYSLYYIVNSYDPWDSSNTAPLEHLIRSLQQEQGSERLRTDDFSREKELVVDFLEYVRRATFVDRKGMRTPTNIVQGLQLVVSQMPQPQSLPKEGETQAQRLSLSEEETLRRFAEILSATSVYVPEAQAYTSAYELSQPIDAGLRKRPGALDFILR